jgi:hypothetical protein
MGCRPSQQGGYDPYPILSLLQEMLVIWKNFTAYKQTGCAIENGAIQRPAE